MTKRREILDRPLFEVFPDNPDDPRATGVTTLRSSLERVLRQRVPDAMAVQKYDIRRPDGTFEERHWSPLNSPVLGEDGEVAAIIHRVNDVTEFVRLQQQTTEREREASALKVQAEKMEAEIYQRAQQLQQANVQLREQNEKLRQMASELAVARELRRSQHLFQAILDGGAAAVSVKDLEGRFLLVNERFQAMAGKSRDELVGGRESEIYGREASEGLEERDRAVVAGGVPIESEEEVLVDGKRHTFRVLDFPLFDLDGRAYAVCRISTDVTAAKRLEAQLRQSQKMDAIGQLAGGVAHDFNNLITTILGYSRLIGGSLGAHPDPQLRDSVQEIQKAGERAAALTRQLLAFSRNQALTPRAVELNAIVQGIEPMLRRLIGEDIHLVTTLRQDSGRILIDPGQLEQVIINLAVNARDAMPAGGTLCLETNRVELDDAYVRQHALARSGCFVLLAVSDTGHGMDRETQTHIFEPFFTTKEVGRGTGLGLSTVYGIVHQSGGWIEVYSEVDQGTIFRVLLPIYSGADAALPESAAQPETVRRPATVLVVEDDPALSKLTRLLLTAAGFEA
ncbi:MAG TPA: PAS domain-containing protein, partial [Thermoanaerobaculia bacterium]